VIEFIYISRGYVIDITPPKGNGRRNGHLAKQNADTGHFMDENTDRKPSKGVRKERQLPVSSSTSKNKKFDLHQSTHINYRSIYIAT